MIGYTIAYTDKDGFTAPLVENNAVTVFTEELLAEKELKKVKTKVMNILNPEPVIHKRFIWSRGVEVPAEPLPEHQDTFFRRVLATAHVHRTKVV